MTTLRILTTSFALLAVLAACGTEEGGAPASDASLGDANTPGEDAGTDASVDADEDTGTDATVDAGADATEDAPTDAGSADLCPELAPDLPGTCDEALEGIDCGWGEECCCGGCSPSIVCSCESGAWLCSATEACNIASCEGRECADDSDCEGGFVTTTCVDGTCTDARALCFDIDGQEACDGATGCTWVLPSACTDPDGPESIAEAGCFPTTDCAFSAECPQDSTAARVCAPVLLGGAALRRLLRGAKPLRADPLSPATPGARRAKGVGSNPVTAQPTPRAPHDDVPRSATGGMEDARTARGARRPLLAL